jgi:dTMP kinase
MHIVFEGIDGAGKTTQASLLCEKLARLNYTGVRLLEPTFAKYGLQIREQMARNEDRGQAAQDELFTLDRKEHVERKIKPLLDFIEKHPSFILVQDRYYLSAPAYQADDEDQMIARLREQQAIAPKPDSVILLDLPVEIALDRLRKTRESSTLFETSKFLEKVRQRYLFLADEGSESIEIVDGTQPPAEICDQVIGCLNLERLVV